MLWIDKDRPRTLDKLDYNSPLTDRLKKLSQNSNLPHLLFHGPDGSGKKTRAIALLRQIFGPGAEKLKQDTRTFKVNSRSVEVNTLSSNYHIEINPSDAGTLDTFVVQEIIKEIAQSSPLHARNSSKTSKLNLQSSSSTSPAAVLKAGFKVVVLNDADSLSKSAQHALRRTMEKYVSGCRLIMISENINKIIAPLRSRCLCLRVAAPTQDEIVTVMKKVLTKEEKGYNFSSTDEVADQILHRIAKQSNRNLRRAMLMLQTLHVESGAISTIANASIALPIPDWQQFITNMTKKICKGQNTQTLIEARKDIYELMGNCIPSAVIMRELTKEMLKNVDPSLRIDVIQAAADYEVRMQQGSKDIFHLEAFIAKFMYMYKKHLVDCFG